MIGESPDEKTKRKPKQMTVYMDFALWVALKKLLLDRGQTFTGWVVVKAKEELDARERASA